MIVVRPTQLARQCGACLFENHGSDNTFTRRELLLDLPAGGSMPFRVERNDLISPWQARRDEPVGA